MEYFDLISSLPLPTPKQTAHFADHVVTNHSWYKHLPFYPPGRRFVFFLNPHAGHGVETRGDGSVSIFELERGDYFVHHSRLSTAEYQDRFGHWEYSVGDAPPWIYSPQLAVRVSLPGAVAQRWSCRLTAFCRPILTMHMLSGYEFNRWYIKAFEKNAKAYPDDPDVARYRPIVSLVKRLKRDAWIDDQMHAFMATEAYLQRDRVLRLLGEIRVEVRPGSARPLAFRGPIPYREADFIAEARRNRRASEIARRGFSVEDQMGELDGIFREYQRQKEQTDGS